MKIGDTVWIPELKTYGKIHELNWDKKLIKSVQVFDPVTKVFKIIDVLNLIVEAVGLIERIVTDILDFFRKPKK